MAGDMSEGEARRADDYRREKTFTQSATLAVGSDKCGREKITAVGSSYVESRGIATEGETVWKSRKQLKAAKVS